MNVAIKYVSEHHMYTVYYSGDVSYNSARVLLMYDYYIDEMPKDVKFELE